jgi:hypothetical protein
VTKRSESDSLEIWSHLDDRNERKTDHLLLMVRRRVADLWRIAAVGVDAKLADWARLYQELLGELGSLASDAALSSDALREQLVALLQAHRARRPRSRAEIVRDRLIEGVRPVRALLKALVALPWKARAAYPLLEVMHLLHGLYERDLRALPTGCTVPLGRVWHEALGGEDRERAFAAAEVATLLDQADPLSLRSLPTIPASPPQPRQAVRSAPCGRPHGFRIRWRAESCAAWSGAAIPAPRHPRCR